MISNREFVKSILPVRSDDANKYSVGSLLCVCGSYSMAGAAILCAKAALATGAGLVRCVVTESIYDVVSKAVPEAVFLVLPEGDKGAVSAKCMRTIVTAANKSDAVVMGCGSKLCEDTKRIAMALMYHAQVPVVFDADGINALSKHINVLKERVHPTLLTPHEGEMSRLTGIPSGGIRADRAKVAQNFADEYDTVLVLKGKGTLIAEKGKELIENPTGNPGMAVAGSGDVLAGIIASLVAQGVGLREAAAAGVYLHGLAGDMAMDELTEYSMLPMAMIDRIPNAIEDCIG